MSSTIKTVSLPQVPAGQKIWADVTIPTGDLTPPSGKLSTTMKKIFQGRPVRKQMIVLQNNKDHLICVYTSTFGASTSLPSIVNEPKDWFLVSPAAGSYEPLPTEDDKVNEPVWVCLSTTFKLSLDLVPVLSTQYTKIAVDKINERLDLQHWHGSVGNSEA